MKKQMRVLLILLCFFSFGCVSTKKVAIITQNKNDSINVLIINKLKQTPVISYIYEKLKNIGFSSDSTVVVKPIFDVYRREIMADFGEGYIGNDTIIIIEEVFGKYFDKLNSIIYTSNNKEKIVHYYFSDGRMIKKEINVDKEEIIKHVQSNQLDSYIEANKHKTFSPPQGYIISLFIKRNDDEYDFSYVLTVR